MKKTGVSLFEILVATVVLSLVLLSLANIFVSVKRNIQHNHCVAVASELSKFFLEPLHNQVGQDTWAANCLGSNSGCFSGTTVRNSISYPYTVMTSTPFVGSELRKAKVTINWTEGT